MKIVHFADLHIGVENYSQPDPSTGISTRLQDFLNAFDQLIDYSLNQSVDVVIFSGDAYKSRDPSQTQQREFASRIKKLSSAGIEVFLLVGNHDLHYGVNRANTMEIFPTLKVPNIHIGENVGITNIKSKNGPLQILSVPWPNKTKLLTKEITKNLTVEEIRVEIEKTLIKLINHFSEKLNPNIPSILSGHFTLAGATNGSEQTMMLGKDHVLPISGLNLSKFNYVALGHIHKHQILNTEPLVVYSGSLQKVDFGEEKDAKGFCVFEVSDSKSGVENFQFIKTKCREFITIECELTTENLEPNNIILEKIKQYQINNAIVRLKIKTPPSIAPLINYSKLKPEISKAHYLVIQQESTSINKRETKTYKIMQNMNILDTLQIYFKSRKINKNKKEKLLEIAKEIIEKTE